MVQKQIIEILKDYISNLNQGGLSIRKAYLYGSHAHGLANEDSDIDIMLISDLFDTDDDVILSLPWSPKLRPDFRIEPLPVGTNRFQTDDISPILQIVRKEGIEIKPR
jgi:uncharacterized protein